MPGGTKASKTVVVILSSEFFPNFTNVSVVLFSLSLAPWPLENNINHTSYLKALGTEASKALVFILSSEFSPSFANVSVLMFTLSLAP